MKNLVLKNGKVFWALSLLVILQACYPNNDSIPISDLDTQSTFYNTNDLATAPTSAALIWEVARLKGDDKNDLPYNGEVDDEILNTTLLQLIELYGETNVVIISETATASPTPTNANIQVIVPVANVDPIPSTQAVFAPSIVLRNKDITIVYPGYGWWGGYPGYPGGCYYCGYPPQVGTASYEVGTVVLDMYDKRQLVSGAEIPEDYDPSWVAIVRGLIGSNGTHNSDRIISGIQRVFKQSPYLN